MMNSQENAARPSIVAALDENVKGGQYYGPTGKREMKGIAGVVDSSELSKDTDIADKLWKELQKLVKFSYL